ncbi:Uncharacterized conserved protein YkaA, UPF0111/DUF47 family [Sphingomonas gellani]|uniref:Uncharacterized conserved protein YkaA, UPF0111/DUF47 family n=2 Tax=Sphingomonas gellani TaxID=1166340 RepID=A0A1H8DMT0_9SPHN|nr:Uncharacterized conserved protein YkaA, UPF0111/DUF47 family [Sphingomonas gellani]
MLITSRERRRWIVPKGNPMVGLAGHEAAAQEAWEEAGLRGVPCAAAIGQFNYLKRRRSGAVRRLTVQVFPLAVVEQLEDWPERSERQTRWFSPALAARSVEEPELQRIIAAFRGPDVTRGIAGNILPAIRRTTRERFPMLAWFQSLMPKQGRFFELFEAHAATLVAGAGALARLLHNDGPIDERITEIHAHEHEADDITRDVLQDVRRVFVTPFDRSAITDLIGVMDDAIDQMNGTATSIQLFGLSDFAPQMRDMSGIIVEAARITAEAIPLLRNLSANAGRLHELTARLIQIEGHADDIHDDGIRALYKIATEANDPMAFVVGREIYSHLEKVVDRFEDVANEIQGLVIDHA